MSAAAACQGAGGGVDAGGAEPPSPRFMEVAAESGIDHVQSEPASAASCSLEYGLACGAVFMTGGLAVGDYDGDGWTDVYATVQDGPDRLYRSSGDGRFRDVAAEAGVGADLPTNGAAWGDVDGDGDLDLAVGTVGGRRLYLYLNGGDGTFVEEAEARGAALVDGEEHVLFSLCFADYDLDGWLDLHATEWRPHRSLVDSVPSHARLLHNLGAASPGHFEDVTEAAGVSMDAVVADGVWAFTTAVTDLDDDAVPDVAVVADFDSSRLFWGRGDGTFQDGTVAAGVGTDEHGMGTAFGDFDGDGRMDWFITSIFDTRADCPDCGWGRTGNRLFRNVGSRRFEDVTDTAGVRDGGWGWGAAAFDYDLDGDVDLAMTNGMSFGGSLAPFPDDPMRLWRNAGDGTFSEVSADAGLLDRGQGRALVSFDYDLDGDLDVLVANHAGPARLFRNEGTASMHWLRVRLHDTGPNRFGVGARVTLRTGPGGMPQVRDLGTCGFLAQNEAVAHFGLGPSRTVAELRVRWPGAVAEQVLRDLPADRTIDVWRE